MAATSIDICNQALAEIGARATITSLANTDPTSVQCNLQYDSVRRQLIRTAPWGFCRKTITATSLGTLALGTSPFPWNNKYAYPLDCLKLRYQLPPPPPPASGSPPISFAPWCGPSRAWPFLVSYDDTGTPITVILSNVDSALFVYNADVTNVALFDELFKDALVMSLCRKLVMPLTGNVGMKNSYEASAERAITAARVVDGNETISRTDFVPDWIRTRGTDSAFGFGIYGNSSAETPLGGIWISSWDSMSWGA